MSDHVSRKPSAWNGGAIALGFATCLAGSQGTGTSYAVPFTPPRTSPNPDLPALAPQNPFEVSIGREVHQAKRVSGLTWDELARVLGVTRRTLHNWANGRPTSLGREVSVRRLLSFLRDIDMGEADRNRALLMADAGRGQLVIDLMRAEQWETALATTKRARVQGALALGTGEARSALDLFDAINDRPAGIEGSLSKKRMMRRKVKPGDRE